MKDNRKGWNPVSHVMAGPVLVASIIRKGNGRQKPVRWMPYWSLAAERMGAVPCPDGYSTRQEAEAVALMWAASRMDHAPYVSRSWPI